MKLDKTFNIHKKLNCIFPFLKLKFLCKKNIHNYRINPVIDFIPDKFTEEDITIISYKKIDETNLKCYCCGKEEKID